MFELLFARPSTIARYRCAPLLNERLVYLARCEQVGIKPATLRRIASHQLDLVRILDLRDDDGLNPRRIAAGVRQWSLPEERLSRPRARRRFFSDAERWLRFLGWLEEPEVACHTHTREVTTFAARMSRRTRMVRCHGRRLLPNRRSLLRLAGRERCRLGVGRNHHGRPGHRALSRARLPSVHDPSLCTASSCLLPVCRTAGLVHAGLAGGILPPRRHRGETIPKGLNRNEVIRVLAATEGDRPCDLRARAVLMLLITYGLRAGEVSGLQLDDLDWEREKLQVRCPKPGRTHLYPLSRGVGQTILRYLREARPACRERRLFVTLNAPIRPLSRGVIKSIVSIRLQPLGITDKRRGPHALRHAAAQHLLDQGLSMKAVGDYLGHRSVAATSVYAKVRLEALREVAEIDLEGLA